MGRKAIARIPDKVDKLAEISKLSQNIEDTSNFIKNLNEEDRKLYKSHVELLKIDTKNELTATEYESIAKMQFFCDRFETLFAGQEIGESNPELLDLYRKMKTQITLFLRSYREGTKATPPSITIIKQYLGKTEDDLEKLKFKGKDDTVIIDVDIEDTNDADPV